MSSINAASFFSKNFLFRVCVLFREILFIYFNIILIRSL